MSNSLGLSSLGIECWNHSFFFPGSSTVGVLPKKQQQHLSNRRTMTLTLAPKRREPALLESFDASFASFEVLDEHDGLKDGGQDGGKNDSLTNFGEVFGTSLTMKSKSDLFYDLESDDSHTNVNPSLFLSKLNLLFDACDFDDFVSDDGATAPPPPPPAAREASLADLDFLNGSNDADNRNDNNLGSSSEALFSSFEDFHCTGDSLGMQRKALPLQGEYPTNLAKSRNGPRPRRTSRLFTPTTSTAGESKAVPPPRASQIKGSSLHSVGAHGDVMSDEPKKERVGTRSKRLVSSRREGPYDASLDARLLKSSGKADPSGGSKSSKENDPEDDFEHPKSQQSLVSDSSKNSGGERPRARPRHRSAGSASATRGRSRSLTSSRHPPRRNPGTEGKLSPATESSNELGTSSSHSTGRAQRRRSISLGPQPQPRTQVKSRPHKDIDPLASSSTHSATRRRTSRILATGGTGTSLPAHHRSPVAPVNPVELWADFCQSGQRLDGSRIESSPAAPPGPTGEAPKRDARTRRRSTRDATHPRASH